MQSTQIIKLGPIPGAGSGPRKGAVAAKAMIHWRRRPLLATSSMDDPANVSVEFWKKFYDDTAHTKQKERGLLPFRVWQFFNAMEDFARAGEVDQFLCAAGMSNREIGEQRFLLEKTVKHDMTSILQKLEVRNLVEAAPLAQKEMKKPYMGVCL